MNSIVKVSSPEYTVNVSRETAVVTKVRYGVDEGYISREPDAALLTQIAASLGIDESTIKACKVQILSN